MPTRIALLILLSAVLAFAIWPTSAGAGPYDVHACRLSDDTRIPAKGWQYFESEHAGSMVVDGCGLGWGLQAGFGGVAAPNGWEAGWTFVAPTGTTVSAFSVPRWGLSTLYPGLGSLEYLATLDAWPSPAGVAGEHCDASAANPCDALISRPFERERLRRPSLSLGLRCRAGSGCFVPSRPGTTMQLEIESARVTLDDPVPPAFASSPILDGTQAAIAVTDIGAGVSTVRIDLDGRLVGRSEPACVPPFLEPVPCRRAKT